MTKTKLLKYFGSAAKVAEAFGVSPAAVAQWGDEIPPLRALQAPRIIARAKRRKARGSS